MMCKLTLRLRYEICSPGGLFFPMLTLLELLKRKWQPLGHACLGQISSSRYTYICTRSHERLESLNLNISFFFKKKQNNMRCTMLFMHQYTYALLGLPDLCRVRRICVALPQ